MDFEYIKRWDPYTFFVSFMTNNTDTSIDDIITHKSKAKLRISMNNSCSNVTGAMYLQNHIILTLRCRSSTFITQRSRASLT